LVPFRLDISGAGDHVKGTLFNGEDTETTTSAQIANGSVQLNFEHYLTSIEATVKNGELDGQVIVERRSPINITPGATSPTVKDTRQRIPRQTLRQARGRGHGECPLHRRSLGTSPRVPEG
jgi:hypothetical protein